MDNRCESCIYFIRHYFRYRNRYSELGMGHCVQGFRTKYVHDSRCACEFWAAREPAKKAK